MKTFRFLFFGLLATVIVCQAKVGGWGGWVNPKPFVITGNQPANPTKVDKSMMMGRAMLSSQELNGNMCIAETITPEIQSLASGLQNNPKRIFDYVHDHIEFQYYFGSKKGAQLTLLERSGSDFDQCALLVALMRAAGYTNLQYQFGTIQMAYDSNDHQDFHHWVRTKQANNVWTNTYNLASTIFSGYGGYPLFDSISGDDNNLIFHHVWVQLTLNGTNYLLDPSFKVSEPIAGLDLHSIIGVNSNNLYTAAAGISTTDSVSGLDEDAVRRVLTGYTTNLLSYLQSNYPNASVPEILSGWQTISSVSQPLGKTPPWQVYDYNGTLPMQTWDNIPTNYMSTLTITFGQANQLFYMPQLSGQRLSITMDASYSDYEFFLENWFLNATNTVKMWLDDSIVLQTEVDGVDPLPSLAITNSVHHPRGYWDTNANIFVDQDKGVQSAVAAYPQPIAWYGVKAQYVLLYAFDPDSAWLHERQKRLDAYRSHGLADDSREVQTETLYIMGLNWLVQSELTLHCLAAQEDVLLMHNHRIGRIGNSVECGGGCFLDIFQQWVGYSPSSTLAATNASQAQVFDEIGRAHV